MASVQTPRKNVLKSIKSNSDPKRGRPPVIRTLPSNDKETVANVDGKGVCICETSVEPSGEVFTCVHCSNTYHFGCMRRNPKLEHCLYCHLKYMIPIKPVRETLFVGILNKGIKRH